MNPPQLIALASATPQPWRNGGGVTRELFTWPPNAPWRLRISVADIVQDGPFSAYPGIDRWFAVLQGAGVLLTLPAGEGVNTIELSPDSDPLFFAGEAAPGCTLLQGATRDLNLMLQRDTGRGSLQRVQAGQAWTSTAPLRGLFCVEPLNLQTDDMAPLPVPAWTLAISTQAAHQRWQVEPIGPLLQAWWLDFNPINPTGAAAPTMR